MLTVYIQALVGKMDRALGERPPDDELRKEDASIQDDDERNTESKNDQPPAAPPVEGDNPPPLPAPHVEVLRWFNADRPLHGWYAVDLNGDPWHWWLNREWARWGDWSLTEARIHLAAALVESRARNAELEQAINGRGGWNEVARGERTARYKAEQRVEGLERQVVALTALVEKAHGEGVFSGREYPADPADLLWDNSDACRALLASAEGKAGDDNG